MRSVRLEIDNNYELFEDGKMFSHKTNRFLKINYLHKSGYPYYTLSVNGSWKPYTIHRLLADSFIKKLQKGDVVCHLDNDSKNYSLSNIIISDQKTNMSHKKIHGTSQVGEKHGCAKITKEIAKNIYFEPGRHADVAKKFFVSKSTVTAIKSRRLWKHIDFESERT